MELLVRHEPVIDYEETARLATEAFGSPDISFSADKLRWLYDISFSQGTTVLSSYAGERKVGQVALVHQSVQVDGRAERAIALVDLFVLKEFRSRLAMADLYNKVRDFCVDEGIRFILAVPNEVGTKVNIRYLKLAPFLTMDIRAGIGLPWRGKRVMVSTDLAKLSRREAVELFDRYTREDDVGLTWTGEGLWARFQAGTYGFGVHATDDVLLVSSPRTVRHMPHTLICALFVRPSAADASRDARVLSRAACALHGRPAFIYAGVNRHIAHLPGFSVPARHRPSPMVLQIRDFAPKGEAPVFDRFELLDFDYA